MAERSRLAVVIRAVLAGLAFGIAAAVGISYIMTAGTVGEPPPPAAVCADLAVPLAEYTLPEGVSAARYCDEMDEHLNLPLGGAVGFEGAFKQPEPPSYPAPPRPAYLDWSTDGCSAPVLGDGPFDFSLPCGRHDFGWRNLKQLQTNEVPAWHTANKDRVDAGFLFDMRTRCSAFSAPVQIGCDTTARVYYTAVHMVASGVNSIPELMRDRALTSR